MGVYTHSDNSNWLSRRGGFLFILIAFHLLMFWALKSGFAIEIIQAITEPIKVEIIEEVKVEPPPPPPPTVKIEIPQVQVPPILVDIPNPEPPPTVLVVQTTPDPVPPSPPIPPQVVPGAGTARSSVVVRPSVDTKPDPADFYPGASRSAGEEGIVRIRLCYDLKGAVGESTLSESSKFPRLDEAAVRMGKRFRIKPGSTDGKKEAGCVVIPVRFSLKGTE